MDENRRIYHHGSSSTSNEDLLTLSLFTPSATRSPPPPHPEQPPVVAVLVYQQQKEEEQQQQPVVDPHPVYQQQEQQQEEQQQPVVGSRRPRRRLNREKKTDDIPQPYPWATNRRATIYGFDYLVSKGITTISGDVQCKKCRSCFKIEFDLRMRFVAIVEFIVKEMGKLHNRAHARWSNPEFPTCSSCLQTNCLKPVLNQKKKAINWLFLFLGEMLGCCSLAQLKYFCKYTDNHRTGAKDRLLYFTYLGICKQLDPALSPLIDRF
ncbi:hypothetical protein BVC80_1715g43 [Macleaya cordata]|uniref:DUF7086 domain-containing protein n=1 Tax=Macleaya cordata TaxID=56857 RepID=A0A200Q263_MACCD|nr:hypothetical protein BVC80_1715g43 [Macleaya cordata]